MLAIRRHSVISSRVKPVRRKVFSGNMESTLYIRQPSVEVSETVSVLQYGLVFNGLESARFCIVLKKEKGSHIVFASGGLRSLPFVFVKVVVPYIVVNLPVRSSPAINVVKAFSSEV